MKYVEIDGHKFCRDEKTGYYLSSKNLGGKRKRLHIYVWEKHNGEIPKGFHVHHLDKDKSNNNIDNLTILSGSKHSSLHGIENSEIHRENFIKHAHPAAKVWHSSPDGLEWHKQHGIEVAKATFTEKTGSAICLNCGDVFHCYEAIESRSHFCTNACKSAWRRKEGLDNEKRICRYCGNEFETNKYSDVGCCSKSCGIKQSYVDKNKKDM